MWCNAFACPIQTVCQRGFRRDQGVPTVPCFAASTPYNTYMRVWHQVAADPPLQIFQPRLLHLGILQASRLTYPPTSSHGPVQSSRSTNILWQLSQQQMEQAHTPSFCAQHRLVLLRETRVHRAACAVTTSSCRCHSKLGQWVRRRSTQLTALQQQQLLQANCAPNPPPHTCSHKGCWFYQAMALQWCYDILSGVHAVLHHTGASCRTHLGAVHGPADRHHSHPLPAAGVCTGGQESGAGEACAIVHACLVSDQSCSRACYLSSSRHRLYKGGAAGILCIACVLYSKILLSAW